MTVSKYTSNPGIYIIKNTKNGSFYLGQTGNLRERWKQHRHSLHQNGHSNRHLQSSWNKYGKNAFKFMVLEYCSIEQLNEREQHWIDQYIDSDDCYNISRDAIAPMRGRKMSVESRQKVSQSLIGNKYNVGKKHSDERKRLTSQKTRGENNPFFGKEHSDRTREKISEANRGRIRTEATRIKMSIAHRNKPKTEEHIQKIKATITQRNKDNPPFKGKKHSEETRLKMSESAKQRWAHKRKHE